MPLSTALIAELRRRLSDGAVVTAADELPAYGRDFWTLRGVPGAVVRPRDAADVAAALRFAAERGVPVAPRAAGTNVSAGFLPAPEGIVLDLRPLDRVLSIDAERREAVVEPGVYNGALNARLAPLGLCFSPDPASAPLSTIGGNIAENAGGPHCLKYGVTVHHVRAVTFAVSGGDLMRFDADEAGPDLLGLIIGSEGTLGVVTEATVRLRPLPAVTRTLLAIFDRAEDAAQAVSDTIAAGIVPAALEFFDQAATRYFEAYHPSGYPTDAAALLLIDVDGDPEEVAADLAGLERVVAPRARAVRRADDDKARAALWQGRLLGAQALVASGRGYFICDTTVPRERIPAMQRRVDEIASCHHLAIVTLGHAGDGNVHPVILFDQDDPAQVAAMHAAGDEVVLAALALGGTLTGEHGVGSEKAPQMALRFTQAELAAQRAVKAAFDPAGVLNPGVLLSPAAPDEPALPLFAARAREVLGARRAGRAWAGESAAPDPAAAPGDEHIVALDAENLTVTAGAAMPLATLHAALAARRLRCPLPEGEGTVGAALSDAAARPAVRDSLLGVWATLPDGQPVHFGSSAVKDVAGYDMKRLFIGTGDAFGAVERVTLKVRPERSAPGGA